ncbi:peptidoglycan editing factor PgeF [Massilia sp. PAMC28688]|uniref:peptidoglycan editing factor PgeF n=1 Tax=Massilia sp. PAMC28688 TaxID=2861283 RepID=UPI001C638038|nr:peptidoglycan editing factor PgeF [Massilia sp. PAMC28688]QYF93303.1 peptidoglycan editing factor PgeF [Massilia sp. PAMC28688]
MAAFDPVIPHWPDAPPTIGALATTRTGGFSLAPYDDGQGGGGLNLGLHCGDDADTVRRNRALLAQHVPGTPAWVSQVHGIAVADAASVQPGAAVQVADASVTSRPGVVCAVMTADCLPVLFADRDGKVVGAAHAGWRGLAGGVLGQTIQAMRAAGAGDITAWLGPAIGPDQFEVGTDVLDSFVGGAPAGERAAVHAAFAPYPGREGKFLADIYALARLFLARDGVTSVAGGEYCTATEATRFFSYRRDHVTGRQASLIWIK